MSDRFPEARLRPQAKPPATTARRRGAPPAAPMAGIVLAGAMLAACSTSGGTSFSLFSEPGKYQYYTCPQIANEQKSWVLRLKDLKALIDKADQSPSGAAVGFIAYRSDYAAANEELEQLHSEARSKKCEGEEGWRSSTVIR
jgi:hypothetical protein